MNNNKLDRMLSDLSPQKTDDMFNKRLSSKIARHKDRRILTKQIILYSGASAVLSALLLLLITQFESAYRAADSSGYVQFAQMMLLDTSMHTAVDLFVAMMLSFPIVEGLMTLINILAILMVVKLLRTRIAIRPSGIERLNADLF